MTAIQIVALVIGGLLALGVVIVTAWITAWLVCDHLHRRRPHPFSTEQADTRADVPS